MRHQCCTSLMSWQFLRKLALFQQLVIIPVHISAIQTIDNKKTGFFQQLVNKSFHFHDLRTFVAIFVLLRFTHFFRHFLLAKIATTATFSAFRMCGCCRMVIYIGPRCTRVLFTFIFVSKVNLSSPRAKRAGPKGPCAESARAVTGRRCPHSGVGEDFLGHRPSPLTKTGVTRERKVVDQIRWSQNLRNDLGYPGFSAKKQVSI